MKKILFILSGNLSTTPRAVKVLQSLSNPKHTVLVSRLQLWEDKDKEILRRLQLDITTLQLGRNPLLPWLYATIIEKTAKLLYVFCKQSIRINAYASNKSSIILWNFLKKTKCNYDMIMGYGAGSLYPVYALGKKWNIPFVFDVEDYHPGEYIRQDAKNEKLRREFLMRTILPQTKFFTTASPLIERYTLDLLYQSKITIPPHKVILNSFPENEFQLPVKRKDEVLKLVWFSQKVSFGRGLEQLLEAMTLFFKESEYSSSKIILSIIGDLDSQFVQQVIQPFLISNTSGLFELNLIPPLAQPKLHAELANHDVGLALEFDSSDLNRQLCLTNKILAYAQAGLFILATNTPAQKQFMEEDREGGIVCEQNPTDMKNALLHLVEQRNEIKEKSTQRYQKSKRRSWEEESLKIQSLWSNINSN